MTASQNITGEGTETRPRDSDPFKRDFLPWRSPEIWICCRNKLLQIDFVPARDENEPHAVFVLRVKTIMARLQVQI